MRVLLLHHVVALCRIQGTERRTVLPVFSDTTQQSCRAIWKRDFSLLASILTIPKRKAGLPDFWSRKRLVQVRADSG